MTGLNSVLSALLDEGYGDVNSEYSKNLGYGLWGIEIEEAQVSIFEDGLRYETDEVIEISYRTIVGIKSSMTIEQVSRAQSGKIKTLVMRFECGAHIYNLTFPIEIYSSLLGYFCDQVKQTQHREVATGFISREKPGSE